MSDPVLPRDQLAEQEFVGRFVANPADAGDLLALGITPSDCVDPFHGAMLKLFIEQYQTTGAVNVALARKLLKPPACTYDLTRDYFDEIADLAGTFAAAQLAASRITEAARKRELHDHHQTLARHALNGWSSQQIVEYDTAFRYEWERKTASPTSLLSDFVPVNQFMRRNHSVEYLIPHVIVAGQPGVISARAKSLKTTIAIEASLSMATATPFLGHWEIHEPIKNGILTAESGEATVRETLSRIALSKSIDIDKVDNLNVSTRCPKLRSREWLDEIKRCIETHELRCLVIDPTYLALAGIDQNKLAAVAEALEPVGDIIRETGCAIVMVHHNRKVTASPYGCPTLEEITGSGFAEWARFWILLNRRREWDDETGRHWLWQVTGGSAGFGSTRWLDIREGKPTDIGGRVWRVENRSAREGESQEQTTKDRERQAKQSEQDEADVSRVCRLMAKYPEGKSKTYIRDFSQVSSRRFPAVFAAMVEAGQLIECEIKIGNKKQPQPGYRLNMEDN